MSQTISSPVTELLTQHAVAYEVVEIPLSEDKKPIRNLEELLSSQGRDPNSVVRSLLFKTGSGQFCLLAVAGGGRADWTALRKKLGEKKLRMAEFDEVSEATGYVVGAVPPIALPETVTVLADNSTFQFEQVIIGSGVLGYALALSGNDLQKVMSDVPVSEFIKIE